MDDDNNGHDDYDDVEFDVIDLFQSNICEINICFEGDRQEPSSVYSDNIALAYSDDDENVDEIICDIE